MRALETRLTALEAQVANRPGLLIVVADQAELEELQQADRVPDGATIIITGVSRSKMAA